MKSIIFTLILVSTQAAQAGWGDVLNKVLNAVGGRVNCVATYEQGSDGVFGYKSDRFTRNINNARSIGDACASAKNSQGSSGTVFGRSSTTLVSLHCTNEKRISFPVNVSTCEAKLGN